MYKALSRIKKTNTSNQTILTTHPRKNKNKNKKQKTHNHNNNNKTISVTQARGFILVVYERASVCVFGLCVYVFEPSLALDPTFGIHSHKTLDTAEPCHLLKPN